MDLRKYDPTIGRFLGMDPVTHHSMGTSVAFDNNPIFWADPTGADGEHYNWDTGKYEDDQGQEVSFETAMASQGLDSSGGETSPPTKFVNENGEEIVNTDDGNDETFVIKNENLDSFVKELKTNISNNKDMDYEENRELGNKYGFNINNILDEYGLDVYEKDFDYQMGYFCGYSPKASMCGGSILAMGRGKGGGNVSSGALKGKAHKAQGIMNVFEPEVFNGNNYNIETNTRSWYYRNKTLQQYIPSIIQKF